MRALQTPLIVMTARHRRALPQRGATMNRIDDVSLIGAYATDDGWGPLATTHGERHERVMAAWAAVFAALLGVAIALL